MSTHVWPFESPSTPVAGRMSLAWARDQGGLCGPQAWQVQLGEWTLGNVKDYVNVSDGTLRTWNFKDPFTGDDIASFPAGTYYAAYCTGAWLDDVGVWAVAKENLSQIVINSRNRIWCQYQNSGVATQSQFNEAYNTYGSYAAACAGAAGTVTPLFTHSGGAIKMGFCDFPTADNGNATDFDTTWTNPRYMLVQIRPWFTLGGSGYYANYTQAASPRWTGHFTVVNLAPAAWTGVTVTMTDPTGLMTNLQSQTVNFTANEAKAMAFTFDAPGACRPVLEVWYGGQKIQEFQCDLKPSIHLTSVNAYQASMACGSCIWVPAVFANTGNMDTTADCKWECKALSGFTLPMQPPGCVPGAVDYVTGTLCEGAIFSPDCTTSSKEFDFYFAYKNPVGSAQLELICTDGTATLLDQKVSL